MYLRIRDTQSHEISKFQNCKLEHRNLEKANNPASFFGFVRELNVS